MSFTRSGRPTPDGSERDGERSDPTVLLELLDAEYTRSILEAISSDAKPARAVAEECGASRPTVYRRLNALDDAGVVDSGTVYDGDGHHRTVFEATLEAVSVGLDGDGVSLTVATTDSDPADGLRRPAD